MGRIAEEIQVKFRVKKSGCWLWEGKVGTRGYGVVPRWKSSEYAHRKVYELFKGEVPDGLQLHHVCGNKKCVNPHHLLPVTPQEHFALSPNSVAYINGQKTHCPNGHEYGTKKVNGKARRHCRICYNDWQRRHRQNIFSSGLSVTHLRGLDREPRQG